MQAQRTESARSKEEICLEAIESGRISIDAEGRIWKHWRRTNGGGKRHYDPPRRADHPDKLGYHRVSLHLDRKGYILFAHRLVWVHKNGRIPDGIEINHIDGVKSNNRLANLELTTHRQNIRHAVDVLGCALDQHGEKASHRKLSWAKAAEMRRRRHEEKPKPTYKTLGKDFGVSGVIARAVCLGLVWKEAKQLACETD